MILATLLPRHPARGQLPGYAAARGFDPRIDVLCLILLSGLPILAGAGGSRAAAAVLRRRRRAGVSPSDSSDAPSRAQQALLTFPTALCAVAAHALLVWTLLVAPLSAGGVTSLALLVGLLAVSLGLVLALGGGRLRDGAVFLGAACAVLPFPFLGRRPAALWLAAGAAALALPIAARLISRLRPEAFLRAVTLAVLLPGSVTALAAAAVLGRPGVADLFEDGHSLLPASEYLRGELPYRDIVPGHGLVADGLLQTASMKLFGDDYRGVRRGEKLFGLFFWPAFYALGYAATGSPAMGFGGLILSSLCFPQYAFPRVIVSLWTLALATYASRAKKPAAWFLCGAALSGNFCVAIDFASYTAVGAAIALWVGRGRRNVHAVFLLLGAVAASAAIAVAFAILGVLRDFAATTFVFIPSLLPVYAQSFPRLPVELGRRSGIDLLRDGTAFLYGFAALSLVLLATLLPAGPRVGHRARAMLPLLGWILAAMLSVVERQHVGYPFFAVPVALVLMLRWLRGGGSSRTPRALASAAALVAVVWLWRPVPLLVAVARAIEDPRLPPQAVAIDDPPRARGALFGQRDARLIRATAEMMRRARFLPGETWLDFDDVAGLYFLFDRDCPIRYYEVPFYESEEAQREVIAAVTRNRRVRAALMSSDYGAIDGIPNSARAPLVAAFLREHFRPFHRDGPVEFWLREDAAEAPLPAP